MMQNLLIRSILAPLGRFAAKVDDRVREAVFLLSAVALFLPCLLQPFHRSIHQLCAIALAAKLGQSFQSCQQKAVLIEF